MAAGAPILYVEATTTSGEEAQEAARNMAAALREDINQVRAKGKADALEDLKQQLAARPAVPEGGIDPAAGELQNRINSVELDSTNQLSDFQLTAGVTSNPPQAVLTIVLATVGGFVLGCVAALGLAALSGRLRTRAEVRDKTGLDTLVELPAGKSAAEARLRRSRLQRLAGIVELSERTGPIVVAVTAARGTVTIGEVAASLAESTARSGRTVLVHIDPTADLVDGEALESFLRDGPGSASDDASNAASYVSAAPYVISVGRTDAEGSPLLTRGRFAAFLSKARDWAEFVVIAAPPVLDSAESQVVCTSADRTILVVENGVARASDVREAVDALTRLGVTVQGAVLAAPEGSAARAMTPGTSTVGTGTSAIDRETLQSDARYDDSGSGGADRSAMEAADWVDTPGHGR
jgi:Mrp family chromosome partitioning ATPase